MTTDKRPKVEARYALHLTFNAHDEWELMLCQAFRMLPHGNCKKVVMAMARAVVGDATDPREVSALLFRFARAPDEMARSAVVGAAPMSWRNPEPQATVDDVRATQRIPYKDAIRAQIHEAPPGYTWAMIPEPRVAPHTAPPPPPPLPPEQQQAPEQRRHEPAYAAPRQLSIGGGLMGGP